MSYDALAAAHVVHALAPSDVTFGRAAIAVRDSAHCTEHKLYAGGGVNGWCWWPDSAREAWEILQARGLVPMGDRLFRCPACAGTGRDPDFEYDADNPAHDACGADACEACAGFGEGDHPLTMPATVAIALAGWSPENPAGLRAEAIAREMAPGARILWTSGVASVPAPWGEDRVAERAILNEGIGVHRPDGDDGDVVLVAPRMDGHR